MINKRRAEYTQRSRNSCQTQYSRVVDTAVQSAAAVSGGVWTDGQWAALKAAVAHHLGPRASAEMEQAAVDRWKSVANPDQRSLAGRP
jgi:hypothetical protein